MLSIRMRQVSTIPALLLVLIVVSCKTPGPPAEPDIFARLEPGNHLGIIEGFNPDNPPELQQILDQKWDELLRAGMSVGRTFIDWRELEPTVGDYQPELLREELEELTKDGLSPFLGIVTGDSESFVGPVDLMASDEDTWEFADGMTIDDPKVIEAWKNLLDWAMPIAEEYGAWGMSFMNEPDNRYLEDHPDEVPGFANFIRQTVDHVHSISDIPVSITVTMGTIQTKDEGPRAILEMLDFLMLNYGLDSTGDDWRKWERLALDEILDAADGRPIVVQEFGLHSSGPINLLAAPGPQNTATEELQREFFEWFFEQMEHTPNLRAAFVFQMVDWSPDLADWYEEVLAAEGLPEFGKAYAEVLKNLGVITYPDGREKPAWGALLEAVKRFASAR